MFQAALGHGPDRHGLICGFLFEHQQPGRVLSLDEALAWLAEPAPSPGFFWLHFSLSDATAHSWMQQSLSLQRLLAPEPGALFRLLHQPPLWLSSDELDGIRQPTEEFALVLQDLAALQERIKLLQEEITAQLAEQTNRSLFTLTVVTVLALPINLVAGLFGMNVGGLPRAENPMGFAWVACSVVVFTGVAGWLALRRRN